jgi:hypothetical protein
MIDFPMDSCIDLRACGLDRSERKEAWPLAVRQVGFAAALWHFCLASEVEIYCTTDNSLLAMTIPRSWRRGFWGCLPSDEERIVCSFAGGAAEHRLAGQRLDEVLPGMEIPYGLGLVSIARLYDPEARGPLEKSGCFAAAMAIVERCEPEILLGARRLLTTYKLGTGDVARLFRRAHVVEEIGTWVGDGNAGRWVEIDEIYEGIKELMPCHRTWKRRPAFRNAVARRLPALRSLGVRKRNKGGATLLKFMPDRAQMDLCRTSVDTTYFREFFPPEVEQAP